MNLRLQLVSTLAVLAALSSPAAQAETRDYVCSPTAVRMDEQKMEIWCTDPLLLNSRSQDRFKEVRRFAFPTIQQNLSPQLGSQFKMLDYYLDIAQRAVTSSRKLHIWFETDYLRSQAFGCEPTDCRAIVGLAITHLPAAPPQSLPEADLSDQ